MKHFTLLAIVMIAFLGFGTGVLGQTTIFSESMGSVSSTTSIATHESNNGFDNDGFTMSGSGDVRSSGASSGYSGASGNANIFITNTAGKYFLIEGISTTGYSSLSLSLGHYKNTNTGNNELTIEVSSNGTDWTSLTYSRPTGSGTASWILITPTGSIPSTSNLRIRFTQTSTTTQFRIDDVKLVGTLQSSNPTKLAVTSVNSNSSPSANTAFSVVVQSQDDSDLPAAVAANTSVTLSVNTGTGSLGGTLTGTILAGETTLTFTDITYSIAETGVILDADATGLTTGTSSAFDVLEAADHLAFASFPSYALVSTNFSSFTVEALRSDNTVDLNYVGNVTLDIESGTGSLSGTLTKAFSSGSISFSDIQINAAGIHSLNANSGTLTEGVSSNIEIVASVQAYRSKASGNWNSASTWQAYTGTQWIDAPDYPQSETKDVTIQSGHSVVLPTSYNSGRTKDLTVESGATLYANNTIGSCFLYVYGDIINNGTIGGSGDVIGFDIEGTSCSLTGSGSFECARIAKYTTTNPTTSFQINQDVVLNYTSASSPALRNGQSGGTVFNITLGNGHKLSVLNAKIDLAGCNLTLKNGSSLLDNGTISNMNGTNVVVEKTLNDANFHLLFPPVNNTVAAAPTFNGYYLDKYVEANGAWTRLTDADNVTPDQGYSAKFASGSGSLSFTGNLFSGDQIFSNLSYTAGAGGYFYGWNLVGNPFPSAVDLDLGGFDFTGLNGFVYVWNGSNYLAGPTNPGGYGTLTDNIIPPFQGFFVRTENAVNTFTIPQAARVHSSQAFYKEAKVIENAIGLTVSGNNATDKMMLVLNPEATQGYDSRFDAFKLFGNADAPQLFTLVGDQKMSVNTVNTITNDTEFAVMLQVGANGEYTLTAEHLAGFMNGADVYLTDLRTQARQNLSQNPSYSFQANTTDDPYRFKISFASVGVADESVPGIGVFAVNERIVVRFDSKMDADVIVSNLAGQVVAKESLSGIGTKTLAAVVPQGIYLVTVVAKNETITRKVFVK